MKPILISLAVMAIFLASCGDVPTREKFQAGKFAQSSDADTYATMQLAEENEENSYLDESSDIEGEIGTRRLRVFERFDLDGDGVLSAKELEALRDEMHSRFLQKFDLDGDGQISQEEKRAVLEQLRFKAGKRGKGKRFRDEGHRGPRGPGHGPFGAEFAPPPPPPPGFDKAALCERVLEHAESWTEEMLNDIPQLARLKQRCENSVLQDDVIEE